MDSTERAAPCPTRLITLLPRGDTWRATLHVVSQAGTTHFWIAARDF